MKNALGSPGTHTALSQVDVPGSAQRMNAERNRVM